MSRKCFVSSVDDSHDPIALPDGEEVVLGRSPLTKIKESKCARQQLSFTASVTECSVRVTQLGVNPSVLSGGLLLAKGESRTLRHGDTVEFLEGLFRHRVCFEPPPPRPAVREAREKESSDEPQPKKLKFFELASNGGSAAGKGAWDSIDQGRMLVFNPQNIRHSSKVAGFDLDWTLIGTKSGRVYPKDKDDWCILMPEIPGKLKKLHADGYKLAIFSNQAGIGSRRVIISEFQQKIENITRKLGVPMQAFISTCTSEYRKPLTGMWKYLVEQKNGGEEIDLAESFYCGDAAGRPQGWAPKKKKDFSSSDRLFAMNIGIKFTTPEEQFQGSKAAPFSLPTFQPQKLPKDVKLLDPDNSTLEALQQEVVVMVGGPGSGKSHFARLHLPSYSYVNMDELKSAGKCLQMLKSGLAAKRSVVVDNTNPDKKSRARFVAEAKAAGVKCRCFKMLASKEHTRHNNKFRELTDPNHTLISEMIIRQYEKNYEDPSKEEGFSEVVGINFVPDFKNEEHKKLYHQFLVA